MLPFRRFPLLLVPALFGLAFLVPAAAWGDPGALKDLLDKARRHEQAREWDKAFAAYDDALKLNRESGVKSRQTAVLRRYWQEQRHKDVSYRKEVLSLDYGQALRLNGAVIDALLETSLPTAKITPGDVLKKGIEELEMAVNDPTFAASYLDKSSAAAISSFREFLGRRKLDVAKLDRRECMKAVREIALAGQTSLDLTPAISLMELACGSCYAIDEYTAYLTPTQFRDLCESVRPMMGLTPTVQAANRSGHIGYMHIAHFQESTPQEVEIAFLTLYKSGMKGLILDLRGNPGGLVESSVDVARRFLASGVIASTESYDPKLSTIYHARNADAWTVPLIVLVDGETASAAELLAGALKENNRARILGQPTFGKGSSQGLIKLPEAVGGLPTGGLRLTIARFFSPKGLPYAGQGVIPDMLVDTFKPDDLEMNDPSIVAAEQELDRLLNPTMR